MEGEGNAPRLWVMLADGTLERSGCVARFAHDGSSFFRLFSRSDARLGGAGTVAEVATGELPSSINIEVVSSILVDGRRVVAADAKAGERGRRKIHLQRFKRGRDVGVGPSPVE